MSLPPVSHSVSLPHSISLFPSPTELTYTRSLETVSKLFLDPLRNPESPHCGILTEDEIKEVCVLQSLSHCLTTACHSSVFMCVHVCFSEVFFRFPVVDELFNFHKAMLKDLQQRLQEWSPTQTLGDVRKFS